MRVILPTSLLSFLVSAGCGSVLPSFTSPINEKLLSQEPSCQDEHFSWQDAGDVVVIVSLSGGGKRAAAFAYGALLGAEQIKLGKSNLLREIDFIHGVSGGATTAAYYALTKDSSEKFHAFDNFLYDDTELNLLLRTANPLNWFHSTGSIQGDYFGSTLYENKHFSAFPRWPRLTISATDLTRAKRFNFSRTQFSCIGSDLEQYPIGHAVAASAAFPLAFGTIPLQNFNDSGPQFNTDQGRSYGPFLHLSDGGLVDNLAVDTFIDLLGRGYLVGDSLNTWRTPAKALIWIRVDGSSHVELAFERSFVTKGIISRIQRAFDAVFEQQVRGSDDRILHKMTSKLEQIGIRGEDFTVFDVSFQHAPLETKEQLLKIPTRWTLSDEDIDLLIKTGKSLVLNDEDSIKKAQSAFQRYGK